MSFTITDKMSRDLMTFISLSILGLIRRTFSVKNNNIPETVLFCITNTHFAIDFFYIMQET